MKLLEIKIIKPLKMEPVDSKYWKLTDDFHVDFITDEGVWKLRNKAGWITDLRSGCDAINMIAPAINMIAPKWGNSEYTATVLMHDTAWSGWMSRQLSNDLLRQGMIMSGEIGSFRGSLVYHAVQNFGHYSNMDEILPEPYTTNRIFESLRLYDK